MSLEVEFLLAKHWSILLSLIRALNKSSFDFFCVNHFTTTTTVNKTGTEEYSAGLTHLSLGLG